MNQHQYSFEISTQYTMDKQSIIELLRAQIRQNMQEQGLSPAERQELLHLLQLDVNQAPNQILNQNNSQNQLEIQQQEQVQPQIPSLELSQIESIAGSGQQLSVSLSDPIQSSSSKSENYQAADMATGRLADEARHLNMIPAHDSHRQYNQIEPGSQNQNFQHNIWNPCCGQYSRCLCKNRRPK